MSEPFTSADSPSVSRGRVLLVAAALLWSTSGVFVKSPPLAAIPQPARGPLLACFRAISAAAVLALFVRRDRIRWRPALVPFLAAFASMNVLFVTAMTRTSAAAAIFLQYTSTVWAFVLGWVLFRERVDGANLFALLWSLAGIGWIVGGDWGGEFLAGNVLALGSGVSYAGVVVSLKWLRDEDSAWLVALCHAAAGVVLLPSVLSGPLALDGMQWTLVVLLGVLQMGLPYVLFARALRSVSTQEAALLTLIEPVCNPIWVWLFWGERVSTATWIGGGLILVGLAGRSLLAGRFSQKPARSR